MKGRIKWFLKASAHHLTMQIGYRYAEKFPMYFVVGFPRSGTSWLSEMIADYYNLPRPRHYYLPLAFACVVHTHFKPNKKFKNTFYIIRDGRDSYVSAFFKLRKLVEKEPDNVKVVDFQKRIPGLMDDTLIKENFAKFLRINLVEENHIWANHIKLWKDSDLGNRVSYLTYESLLTDPIETLKKAISNHSEDVNTELLTEICNKHSFKNQSKRPVAQHRTILRSGKKNDWKNHFNEESAKLFNKYNGEMLVELGYEADNKWIEEFKS